MSNCSNIKSIKVKCFTLKKLQRNDGSSCGSGLKYKKCCLIKTKKNEN